MILSDLRFVGIHFQNSASCFLGLEKRKDEGFNVVRVMFVQGKKIVHHYAVLREVPDYPSIVDRFYSICNEKHYWLV